MPALSDFSGPLTGREATLEEAARASGGAFASMPTEFPPWHWINQAPAPDRARLDLAWLQDVVVTEGFCLHLPRSGQMVTEISYPRVLETFRIPHLREGGRLTLTEPKPVLEVTDPVLLIGGQDNHYHFLLNWLPRILVLWRLGRQGEVPERLKFAVHHGISDQHLAALRMCGVRPRDIVTLRPDVQRILLRDAIVPSFFSSHCYYQEVLDFLAEMADRIPAEPHPGLYLSRNALPAARRRIRNEAEVAALCESHGLVRLELERMSFRDQVAAFRGARAIVGAHGAGMANLAFCAPGTDVLLFEYKQVSEFADLAALCRLRCTSLMTPQAEEPGVEPRNRDFVVDTGALRAFLEGLPPPA